MASDLQIWIWIKIRLWKLWNLFFVQLFSFSLFIFNLLAVTVLLYCTVFPMFLPTQTKVHRSYFFSRIPKSWMVCQKSPLRLVQQMRRVRRRRRMRWWPVPWSRGSTGSGSWWRVRGTMSQIWPSVSNT